MNLHKLTHELSELQQEIWEADGEITQQQALRLQQLTGDKESKIMGYIKIIQNFQSRADATKNEMTRLNTIHKRAKSRVTNLRGRLTECLDIDERISTPIGDVSVYLGPPALECNTDDIPLEYTHSEVTFEGTAAEISELIFAAEHMVTQPAEEIEEKIVVDKARVKKILMDGGKIDGATLTRKKAVRIT